LSASRRGGSAAAAAAAAALKKQVPRRPGAPPAVQWTPSSSSSSSPASSRADGDLVSKTLSSKHAKKVKDAGRNFASSSLSVKPKKQQQSKQLSQFLLPRDGRSKPLRPCPLCGKGCSGGAALANHIKTHSRLASSTMIGNHGAIAKATRKASRMSDDGSEEESEEEEEESEEHMQQKRQQVANKQKQSIKKPVFPCTLCGKEFMGHVALMHHIDRKHSSRRSSNSGSSKSHGNGAKSVQWCEICGKECLGGAALANHTKTHGREASLSSSSSSSSSSSKAKLAQKVVNPIVNNNNNLQYPRHCDGLTCHCQHSHVAVSPILVRAQDNCSWSLSISACVYVRSCFISSPFWFNKTATNLSHFFFGGSYVRPLS